MNASLAHGSCSCSAMMIITCYPQICGDQKHDILLTLHIGLSCKAIWLPSLTTLVTINELPSTWKIYVHHILPFPSLPTPFSPTPLQKQLFCLTMKSNRMTSSVWKWEMLSQMWSRCVYGASRHNSSLHTVFFQVLAPVCTSLFTNTGLSYVKEVGITNSTVIWGWVVKPFYWASQVPTLSSSCMCLPPE